MLRIIFNLILIVFPVLLILFIISRYFVSYKRKTYRKQNGISNDRKIVAFFHPYCNAGGGGERVLWCAIRALHRQYPSFHYVVYTGDIECSASDIINKAKTNFKIDLDLNIDFVFLRRRKWVESHMYPYFTLLAQSLGSIYLGLEALDKCVPDIYVDSMGFSFTLPVFKWLADCKVVAYVHYPTISTDMLNVVAENTTNFNNRSFIANNRVLTRAKLIYYYMFAYLYGVMGKAADLVMVNSSWTQQHIQYLWNNSPVIVYPPCNTSDFKTIKLEREKHNLFRIVSIGQIRPEKNHSLQLKAFSKFISRLNEDNSRKAKLIIIGSCRNIDDENRVKNLRLLANSLNIADHVEFKLNVSYDELKYLIENSSIGLHTMINEHFGIGVVECLASGLITVSHDSGGPKMDIITAGVSGFLASNVDQFSDILYNIVNMDTQELNSIRLQARQSVEKFSEQQFDDSFLKFFKNVL